MGKIWNKAKRSVSSLLRSLVGQNEKKWDSYIPQAEFAFNSGVNRSSKVSPFLAAYGYIPKQTIDISEILSSNSVVENIIEKNQKIYKAVEGALQQLNINI